MHIPKNNSKIQDWENVKSWNYKLPNPEPSKSVVYAEITGEHGEVTTKDSEWVYYIIEGNGEFTINGIISSVYNYTSKGSKVLKVVMFIDLWDN